MSRRSFGREFKLESVRLVSERGLTVSQAARDLDVHENVLRKWMRQYRDDPAHAFPGAGQMKPEQAEITQLKQEIRKLKAERDILKNRLRGLPRPMQLETRGATLSCVRTEAVSFLEASTPSKNLVQGKLRTQCWWRVSRPRLGK